MAFEPYGGYVWTSQDRPPERDWKRQGITLGVLAGAGIVGGRWATTARADASRPIDTIASGARAAGNLSPFQILNTFRISEILSPYTSPLYQQLTPKGSVFEGAIGAEYLRNADTYEYLKKLTGLDTAALRQAGIVPEMKGAEAELASRLIFERTAESATGKLFSEVGDKRHLLSSKVMLQQFSGENLDLSAIIDKTSPVNRGAFATLQAMGFMEEGGSVDKLFKMQGDVPKGVTGRPAFIPVPALGLETNSVSGFLRGSTLARALPAFSMERFNRLLQGFSDQVLGSGATKTLERLGVSLNVTSGPASSMFFRFGGKAALAGGVIIGASQLDWFRRQYGGTGELVASGAFAGGAAYLAHKAGFKGRTALMAGVASFFGQLILPGFDQGIVPGLATVYTRSQELRGLAVNPVNYYRRTLEGYLPGSTSWQTGALLGVGVAALSYGKVSWSKGGIPYPSLMSGKGIPQAIMDRWGDQLESVGLAPGRLKQPVDARELFWRSMLDKGRGRFDATDLHQEFVQGGGYTTGSMRRRLMARYTQSMNPQDLLNEVNSLWAVAEQRAEDFRAGNPINQSLIATLERLDTKYAGKKGFFSEAMRQTHGLAEQWKHAFYGADFAEEGLSKALNTRLLKAPLGRLGLLFGGTVLMQQVLSGGLLGSMETRQELQDIHSGKQLIEVGKSRFWETGSTPWEGTKTSYYRPSWYALMMNRVREKGIWGEGEDEISPIGKFLRKNFTYQLEEQNYYDRPYPMTSAAFSDVPIIGGILAGSIGRLIKPPKLMHEEEWMRGGEAGTEYANVYRGWRQEPAYNLGAIGKGTPGSPYSVANQLSAITYQFRQLEGLTGWSKDTLSNLLVGTDTYFTDQQQLAEAGMMTSWRMRFWEMSTGGMGFMNEALRRIMPSYRKEIERYNPIINNLPTWIPEGQKYGDPFRNVEWGEARMPGRGYESLHPELKGTDPEDYPLIYQYDILAGIAPYSNNIAQLRERLYQARSQGAMSEPEAEFMDRIDRQLKERYEIYDFKNVHDNAIQGPGSSVTQGLFGFGKKIFRKAAAPVEYLMPAGFRPVHKLLGDRGAVERYEYERLYGAPFAFWDKPWHDFLRPALYSTAHFMGLGFKGKPLWRQEADNTDAYFDQLEFYKWMRLAEQAGKQGDTKGKARFEYQASTTRMGVNPHGSPLSIYWSLPESERPFFNAFALAEGRERKRILQMVPEDQQHLYQAVWSRLDSGDDSYWAGTPSKVDTDYLYQQYYGMNVEPTPPEDWVGYLADVSVDDIKVKYVDELGKDMHDFGVWESQVRDVRGQPYLEDSTRFIHDSGGLERSRLSRDLRSLTSTGFQNPSLHVSTGQFSSSTMSLEYNDHRDFDIGLALRGYLSGY